MPGRLFSSSVLFRVVLPCCMLVLSGCASSDPVLKKTVSNSSADLSIEALLSGESSAGGANLVSLAQAQLGRPYRYGGTTPVGFDCSGLVFYVHREAGLSVPRTSQAQYQSARKVKQEHLLPGDLLFFRVSSSKISHVAIYVGDAVFIHAPSSGKGVSYASLEESYWQQRLVGAGRYY